MRKLVFIIISSFALTFCGIKQPKAEKIFEGGVEVGRIFIMSFEKKEGTGEYTYDIFNQEGLFIGRKSLDIMLSGETWGLYNYVVVKNNRLYHLRTKESGYKELVVYKMKWE